MPVKGCVAARRHDPGKAIINEREFHKDLCGATVTPRQGAI